MRRCVEAKCVTVVNFRGPDRQRATVVNFRGAVPFRRNEMALCLHQDVQEAIHSRRPQQAGIQPRRLQEARECGTVVNFRGLDHQSVKLSPISRVLCSFVGTKCDLLQELCPKLWPVLPESLPEYSPRSARIAARILARIGPRTPAQNCCRNAARITARIFTQVCPNCCPKCCPKS